MLGMRLVVTAPDYEVALAFYCDVLGMRELGVSSSALGLTEFDVHGRGRRVVHQARLGEVGRSRTGGRGTCQPYLTQSTGPRPDPWHCPGRIRPGASSGRIARVTAPSATRCGRRCTPGWARRRIWARASSPRSPISTSRMTAARGSEERRCMPILAVATGPRSSSPPKRSSTRSSAVPTTPPRCDSHRGTGCTSRRGAGTVRPGPTARGTRLGYRGTSPDSLEGIEGGPVRDSRRPVCRDLRLPWDWRSIRRAVVSSRADAAPRWPPPARRPSGLGGDSGVDAGRCHPTRCSGPGPGTSPDVDVP